MMELVISVLVDKVVVQEWDDVRVAIRGNGMGKERERRCNPVNTK